jgi:hypothetical protein
MALAEAEIASLRALEESMWRSETRFDTAYMEATLHPDFVEVGRSGIRFSRDDVLAMPAVRIDVDLPKESFVVSELAPGVALVTYESVFSGPPYAAAHRSSVWVQDDGRWLLRYHQGTPAAA